ncbi:hypothetical protein DEM27_26095 [Metarhizobium album]|uniref:Uncharacterized protein n=2 Tax=Metarhizobium album TaxID=2182425 RepID=A0A2U2DJJ4_9HYPH|nr:hypothetical protein DEM27_26095 [Rhizobium album]
MLKKILMGDCDTRPITKIIYIIITNSDIGSLFIHISTLETRITLAAPGCINAISFGWSIEMFVLCDFTFVILQAEIEARNAGEYVQGNAPWDVVAKRFGKTWERMMHLFGFR